MKKTFKIGGVDPQDNKLSKDCAIEELPLPKRIYIAMNQHLGAPACPVVAKGDKVLTGQLIAKAGGIVSAPVHASASGTVADIALLPDICGRLCTTVVIDVEGDEWAEDIDRSDKIEREIVLSGPEIIEKIASKGIVGLGGAAFPTHVKLSPPPGKKAEYVILNGTECEPYLTSDYRIMLERTEEILIGGEIIRKALGTEKGFVGIEDNKPAAIERMREMAKRYPAWEVVPLKQRYPQGGEKQLIEAILGRRVPSMALPIDVGTVVQNVGTALAVYEAVQKNKPLIDHVVSVTSIFPDFQKNFKVRVGTPIQNLIDAAGGMREEFEKIISGGPMMGKVVVRTEAPTVKSTGSILLLTGAQTKRNPAGACIRCAKCVGACPMGLEPYLLFRLAKAQDYEAMEKHKVQDCIECGCCLYTCPAYIPLLDLIRLGKAQVLKNIRSRAKK